MMYLYKDTLGEIILFMRKEAGFTQADLCAKIGCSRPVVSQYEGNKRIPSVPMLMNIIDACGFTVKIEMDKTKWIIEKKHVTVKRLKQDGA